MDLYPVPDIGHVSFSGLNEPCSIGSIVEVVVSGLTSLVSANFLYNFFFFSEN